MVSNQHPHRNECNCDNCTFQSFKSLLCANQDRLVTVYATFGGNSEWNAKIFKGVVNFTCCGLVVLSDPQTGIQYAIPYEAIDWLTFEVESGTINPGQDCCTDTNNESEESSD